MDSSTLVLLTYGAGVFLLGFVAGYHTGWNASDRGWHARTKFGASRDR